MFSRRRAIRGLLQFRPVGVLLNSRYTRLFVCGFYSASQLVPLTPRSAIGKNTSVELSIMTMNMMMHRSDSSLPSCMFGSDQNEASKHCYYRR